MVLPVGGTKEQKDDGDQEEGPCDEGHIDQGGPNVLNELLRTKPGQVKVLIEGSVIVIIWEIAFLLCQPREKPILSLKDIQVEELEDYFCD